MKTKTVLMAALVAGSLFAWNTAVRAQDSTNTPPAGQHGPGGPGGPGAMRGRPGIEQIAKALNLTDDQKAKVKDILDSEIKQLKDLHADTTLSQDDRRAKMKSIREETTAKLKAILTPEQLEKFQKMRRGPGGPPPQGGPQAAPKQ